tara:strand:- start:55 stop:549 length:495 start_codon:yes stop_codon:yes gene_type:complete
MANIIDYKTIMHSASLDAIRTVLLDVSKNGLPGKHHFYITFDMSIEGVETSISLKEQYPNEMTIVIQNWYDEFIVNDSYFSITLNFGNILEKMRVPFSAIKSFVDPSVEFGLNFDPQPTNIISTGNENKIDLNRNKNSLKISEDKGAPEKKTGDVVSLENFRKS